jgi:3-hydroxymyristoyl/3-hydroxydecanoyl-(acyl carrier protein) dehydratase
MVNSHEEHGPETWHLLTPGKMDPDGSLTAEVRIGAGSPWFSGHFPNGPVLPGIALLAMVSETIRSRQAQAGKKVKISRIRKVRFRLPVRPDSSLSLKLSCPDDEKTFVFKIALNGETVCTGIMEAEPL